MMTSAREEHTSANTSPVLLAAQSHLKKTLAVARASQGWSWQQLSDQLAQEGFHVSAGNLATKFSRMTFRADELLVILKVLRVSSLSTASLSDHS